MDEVDGRPGPVALKSGHLDASTGVPPLSLSFPSIACHPERPSASRPPIRMRVLPRRSLDLLPEGAVENSPGLVRRGGRSPGSSARLDATSPVGAAELPQMIFDSPNEANGDWSGSVRQSPFHFLHYQGETHENVPGK